MSLAELPVASPEVSAHQRQLVLATLRTVLDSQHFCKSKRYPAFLDYVVRYALDENLSALKERTVGVELFGRSPDYDTSTDSVVRVAAGEVRKRLIAYFRDDSTSPVRIEIPVGSYHVEFHFRPAVDRERTASGPHSPRSFETTQDRPQILFGAIQGEQTYLPSTAAATAWWKQNPFFALAMVLLLLVGGAAAAWKTLEYRDRGDFWEPVLGTKQPAVILVGRQRLSPQGNTDSAKPMGPAVPSTAESNLALEDAVVTANICTVFHKYGTNCKVESATTMKVEDLQGKSIILVGGLDNLWTLRALSSLPYRFKVNQASSSSGTVRSVLEHSSTGDVQLGILGADEVASAESSQDYAIIARFHSDITERPMVVLAGLGRAGTSGAGAYVNSPEKWRELSARAPKGWKGENVEAVLKIDVVGGSSATTKVIAARYW